MSILKTSFFRKFLLPGFVFQSVIIAGGYGTGRELIEYFLNFGPLGGLLGMLCITTTIWAVILALTFEFSRKFNAYDYRTFFKALLGPIWPVFEVIYMLFLLIVLAVIGSAAGILLRDNFGVPYIIGVMIMLLTVGFLTFKGSGMIENFLSIWSILLYITYGVFFIAALIAFGPIIKETLREGIIKPGWAIGGFKYALYNLGTIPAVFFCLRHIKSRKEAISAGFIGGVIGILPAVLFYFSVLGRYPSILPEELPAIVLLRDIGFPALLFVYQIILFGTLIETGTGFIHSVNERIQSSLEIRGRKFPVWLRPVIAVSLLLMALGISTFGLITLISKGYGAASWAFLAVYILPLLTLGIYRIINTSK